MSKIIAHRGASAVRPENTMSAFKRALEMGADGFETDIFVLHDKTAISHHDFLLGRCENVDGNIYDYRKDTVKSFSVGEKFSKEYEFERIAYLEELLKLVKENNWFIEMEIKADIRQECCFINNQEEVILPMVEKYNLIDNCLFISFNHTLLKRIKKKNPMCKVGMLYLYNHGIDVISYAKKHGFDVAHLPNSLVADKKIIKAWHDAGIELTVGTDRPTEIERMLELGVDYICCNDVEKGLEIRKKYLSE